MIENSVPRVPQYIFLFHCVAVDLTIIVNENCVKCDAALSAPANEGLPAPTPLLTDLLDNPF